MLNEVNLKAALKAEADLARVPAADILHRVRQSGVRVRKPSIWTRFRPRVVGEVLAVVAVAALVVVGPSLADRLQTAAPAGTSAPAAEAPATEAPAVEAPATIDANGLYDNRQQGFRLTFPPEFSGPVTDEQGALLFTNGSVEVSVHRRERQSNKGLEDLLGDQVAATLKQNARLKPVEVGLREVNGRMAAMVRVTFISAAAWFDRATYVIPTAAAEYTVSCGSVAGAQLPWDKAGPLCDQILSTLEVGTEQGYMTRTAAQEAALAAVQGEYDITMAQLAEQWESGDGTTLPVWRVQLTPKAEGETPWMVVIEAKTGRVYHIENMTTGEKTRPQ